MTLREAYRILDLPPETELSEVKRKYRSLMMQVHPDAGAQTDGQSTYAAHPAVSSPSQSCPHRPSSHTAQEINRAYAFIKEKISGVSTEENSQIERSQKEEGYRHAKDRRTAKQSAAWNSPVNESAYREREVLQYVEDYDGAVIGNFCVAKGKYMWTTDEDFSLFLLSLYRCGRQILDEIDTQLNREDAPADRPSFQAELTYLLAQQFIAQTALLQEIVKEEKTGSDGQSVFYIPSMLEAAGQSVSLKPGDNLYPAGIRQHRLYLKDQSGQETGYLSFSDDRLYYIVVPLLEQKSVRIKIRVAKKQPEKKKARYQNLDLWIKPAGQTDRQLPENLNLQIEQLLEKYR